METGLTTRKELSEEQRSLLKRTIAQDTTNDEFQMFVYQCNKTGLDPFARQIYCFKARGKLFIGATIDGFRLVAQRTGELDGQLGPFWCGEDGVWKDVWLSSKPPAAAKVGVLRKGCREPFWGVALYRGYVQANQQGQPAGRWANDAPGMLAKCAEALGHRKAFPQELSGVYSREEMDQVENPDVVITVGGDSPAEQLPAAERAKAQVKEALAGYDVGSYVLPWPRAKKLTGKDNPTLNEIYLTGDLGISYLKWVANLPLEEGARQAEGQKAVKEFLSRFNEAKPIESAEKAQEVVPPSPPED